MQSEDKEWIEYRERFSEVYDDANSSSRLQSSVMRASHKLVEKAYDECTNFSRILEIGAGTGEHLPYVRHRFDEYILSDPDQKTLEVARNKLAGMHAGQLRFVAQTGSKLDYPEHTFDRLVATHVLEHIYHPHLVLKEWLRVLKPAGVLSILIPTDPGLAWRLGRHLGPQECACTGDSIRLYHGQGACKSSCNNL